jgi:hypothetical protein
MEKAKGCEIRILGPNELRVKDLGSSNLSKLPNFVNTTSRSTNWSVKLSPFFLGPIPLYDGNQNCNMISLTAAGTTATNLENAWQFAKVHEKYADGNKNPSPEYFKWARSGLIKIQSTLNIIQLRKVGILKKR